MKMLRELILEGKIPYFRIVKTTALFLAFLPLPIFFLFKISPRECGELGWNILIGIMLIRPLADVFPGIKLLHSLVLFRKEFGIASAWLMILHAYGNFAAGGKNIFVEILKPEYWKLSHPLMWGILGLIVVTVLLLTSNSFSMRVLRQNWKRIQKSAYLLFFLSAIHIALISEDGIVKVILPVLLVMILWTVASLKIKVPIFTKPESQTK